MMNPTRILLALGLGIGHAHAAVLFSDSFDRADTGVYNDTTNGALDDSLSGITDNTGSGLSAGGVYQRPHTAGGAGILSNELLLSSGTGTSNAYVDHNFTNPTILADGGFSVSLDVTGYSGDSGNPGDSEFGGGFAVGMSQSEADSTGDAFGGEDANPRMTAAFDTDTGNTIGGPVPPGVVSDFWVTVRGNNSLVWGTSSGNILGRTPAQISQNTGNIRVDFFHADFQAGSTVNYDVYLDDALQDSGSFTWSGTEENYIGIDSRDGQGVTFDNLSIETIPEPSLAILGSLGLLGLARRRR